MKRLPWIAAALVIAGLAVSIRCASGDAGSMLQDQARREKCKNNLQQVWAALGKYRGSHGGYPSSLQALADAKLIDATRLKCPSAPGNAAVSYQIAPGAKGAAVLCRCGGDWHLGGRNVVKADGTVEYQK